MTFSPDDLKEWRKDPKGEVFWEAVKENFSRAISNLRNAVRTGDFHKAAYDASQADAAEEMLQLHEVLIKEQQDTEVKDED
jgi:hypothetical protein